MKQYVVLLRKMYPVMANNEKEAKDKALILLKHELLEFCKYRKTVAFDIKADALNKLLKEQATYRV